MFSLMLWYPKPPLLPMARCSQLEALRIREGCPLWHSRPSEIICSNCSAAAITSATFGSSGSGFSRICRISSASVAAPAPSATTCCTSALDKNDRIQLFPSRTGRQSTVSMKIRSSSVRTATERLTFGSTFAYFTPMHSGPFRSGRPWVFMLSHSAWLMALFRLY